MFPDVFKISSFSPNSLNVGVSPTPKTSMITLDYRQDCPPQDCPLGGNLEVGNPESISYQDCPPQYYVFVCLFMLDMGPGELEAKPCAEHTLFTYNQDMGMNCYLMIYLTMVSWLHHRGASTAKAPNYWDTNQHWKLKYLQNTFIN